MEKAVGRICLAIEKGEKILVYGDYDVDGTCSVAMVYRFLRKLTPNVSYYFPDRETEGYGVSDRGIDHAIGNGVEVMISLDCGIKAVSKVARAQEAGIDFIICDHHLAPEQLPNAFAILNAKQAGCAYPYKELCGCGVGFKLLQALTSRLSLPAEEALQYLDFVAVATCCDIVPLTGENRILVHNGLIRLNSKPAMGFDALLQIAGAKMPVGVEDVVFKIGPRINAAGRLFSADHAMQLLCAEHAGEAEEHCRNIEDHNRKRRQLDKNMSQEALEMINAAELELSACTTVVYNEGWHKGVVGIVASRLIETYHRPTVVLTSSGELISGSARSVPGFDVHEALSACEDLMERFGGHQQAAGMSLRPENLVAFRQRFEEEVKKRISGEMLIPVQAIDISADFHQWLEVSELQNGRLPRFFRQMKRMEPFGPEHLAPVFATSGCEASEVRIVGGDHLRFQVFQPQRPELKLNAIAFKMGRHFDKLISRKRFSLAYNIGTNTWQNRTTLQLDVKDIRFEEEL